MLIKEIYELNIRFHTSNRNLIFPIRPIPKGSSKNQFAPFAVGIPSERVRGKQIDFYGNRLPGGNITDIHIYESGFFTNL